MSEVPLYPETVKDGIAAPGTKTASEGITFFFVIPLKPRVE